MTIKERFRRALHKSDSSSSLSQSDSNTTATTTTTNTSQSSLSVLTQQKPPTLHLTRTFTWGTRDKAEKDKEREERRERKEAKKRRNAKPMHPSEKPLTAQNLRHQEMLGHFTMTFGATSRDELGPPSLGGVSPCCTRPASIVDTDEF